MTEGTKHVRFVRTHSKIMTISFDVNIPLGKLGARIFWPACPHIAAKRRRVRKYRAFSTSFSANDLMARRHRRLTSQSTRPKCNLSFANSPKLDGVTFTTAGSQTHGQRFNKSTTNAFFRTNNMLRPNGRSASYGRYGINGSLCGRLEIKICTGAILEVDKKRSQWKSNDNYKGFICNGRWWNRKRKTYYSILQNLMTSIHWMWQRTGC